MTAGEILTRWTVRLALILFAASLAWRLAGPHWKPAPWPRRLWTAACGLYLAHVVCAFGFMHDWSHLAALTQTARRTEQLTGWKWGGGLYFNYLFTIVWTIDAAWWWLHPATYRAAGLAHWLIYAFMLFMAVNGAIVFAEGPTRYVGLAIGCGLAVLWCLAIRRRGASSA